MGGNIMIDGFPPPTSYDVSSCDEERKKSYAEIYSILSVMNKNAIKEYGCPIFYSQEQFCGSSRYSMDINVYLVNRMNDVDILIDENIFEKNIDYDLDSCFFDLEPATTGFRFAGIKNHGKQTSVLVSVGDIVRQFDFVKVDRATSYENKFLHYADLGDRYAYIKGVHHKLLLNSIHKDWKFSITHGLKRRDNTDDYVGRCNPYDICSKLFVKYPNVKDLEKVWTFRGLVDLFIKYKTGFFKSNEDKIYIMNKFTDSCGNLKNVDSTFAINYLHRKFL